jgi:phosphoribosylglycinamide formyltransferase-1
MAEFRIVVLASGRGSNLRALLDARREGRLGAGARIVAVASNKPSCAAVALAKDEGIETLAFDPRDFASREDFDQALLGAAMAREPDLLVCAGFMRVLSAGAVALARGRLINIHPSLLPKFPGLRTHERALAEGEREHGCSVHQVVPEVDAGPVIAQARVPVLPGDDADALAARVLRREHPLLVGCVRAFAEGRLTAGPAGVAWQGNPLHAPLSLDDQDRLAQPF